MGIKNRLNIEELETEYMQNLRRFVIREINMAISGKGSGIKICF